MISSVTVAIFGVFGILFAIVVIAFVLVMRQNGERPRRYRPRKNEQRTNDVSSGYIPYRNSPELERGRRESMVAILVIIFFIIISILASFFL
ncbi:MAG: hypothetical protein JRN20_00685 [Nitrososphaerota archaeon]|nr:hypothetical protein [Nitrososphaerota archaeon]MDG6921774.1 hypothetical protein [Nitrososphaerota archaeon]